MLGYVDPHCAVALGHLAVASEAVPCALNYLIAGHVFAVFIVIVKMPVNGLPAGIFVGRGFPLEEMRVLKEILIGRLLKLAGLLIVKLVTVLVL